jgi:hypothetical protein
MPASALTENIKIQSNGGNDLYREVSRSQSISFGSTSPIDTFRHRPSWGQDGSVPNNLRRTATGAIAKQLKPFREQDIKILLLENVNQTGQDILQAQGYQVESLKSSLPEDQLIERIRCRASTHSFQARLLTPSFQRRPRTRHSIENAAHSPSPSRGAQPDRGRLLLHRHEPSRPKICRQPWDLCLQFTFRKLPLRRRVDDR